MSQSTRPATTPMAIAIGVKLMAKTTQEKKRAKGNDRTRNISRIIGGSSCSTSLSLQPYANMLIKNRPTIAARSSRLLMSRIVPRVGPLRRSEANCGPLAAIGVQWLTSHLACRRVFADDRRHMFAPTPRTLVALMGWLLLLLSLRVVAL